MNVNLKRRLIAKRKDIKNKLDLLKYGKIVQEDMFSPITKHLRSIENKLVKKKPKDDNEVLRAGKAKTMKDENKFDYDDSEDNNISIKQEEVGEEGNFENDDDDDHDFNLSESLSSSVNFTPPRITSTPQDTHSRLKQSLIEDVKHDEEDKEEKNMLAHKKRQHDLLEQSFQDYLSQYEPLTRKYIRDMLNEEKKREFDHKYGIRFDPVLEKFSIGNSQLLFKGSDIVVQNKTYRGTKGLYELLFKKNPKEFSAQDERMYKEIVLKTNAHKRYYKASNQIDGSKLKKYKKIIAPITGDIGGDGMLNEVTDNTVDYVYWDDPNELCDRLRLLLASQQAGHNSHINEINSIVEELREAQIIE